MFFLEYYGMLSGGALGALTVGLVTSNFWERGIPRRLSLGANFHHSPEGAFDEERSPAVKGGCPAGGAWAARPRRQRGAAALHGACFPAGMLAGAQPSPMPRFRGARPPTARAHSTFTAVERVLAIIWSWVMEPMLFVTIGSSIYFKTLPSGTVPKSLVIICTGEAAATRAGWAGPHAGARASRTCCGTACGVGQASRLAARTGCPAAPDARTALDARP